MFFFQLSNLDVIVVPSMPTLKISTTVFKVLIALTKVSDKIFHMNLLEKEQLQLEAM